MEEKDILKFCIEKGLLVDSEVLRLFKEESDIESVKFILEKVQKHTDSRVITKKVFSQNKEKVREFFSSLPGASQGKFESLKIKLGLSIEISREAVEEIPINENPSEHFESSVKVLSMDCQPGKKFGLIDFLKYYRNRFMGLRNILQDNPSLENLVSINKLSSIKQNVSLIGMIIDKRSTKNKNIILEVEDLTGTTKILVNNSKEELIKKAEEVALDSVIGFKCSGNREILFANDLIFPDARILERKKSPVEEYALFIGDLQAGSHKFMKDNFLKFIDYLNGEVPDTPEVEKIKYLFILGDLVSGIGVYPDHDRDLAIDDLEEQFNFIADLLGKIRKDIKIIITPGNHEGIRLMEPQPLFNEKYAWKLYEMDNVILAENPSWINFGGQQGFPGFNLLIYHGFSYPFYANNVSSLMKEKAMNAPEKIMTYLLKHRHLAPTSGSVQYFPSEKDIHLIKDVPDILASGHTHKGAVAFYNNILLISCASWESLTPYQEKFGNQPDFCKVPMLNLKTGVVKILDFE